MDAARGTDVIGGVSVKALRERIDALKKNQMDDCSICLKPPNLIAFTLCGHVFCEDCISDWHRMRIAPIAKKTSRLMIFLFSIGIPLHYQWNTICRALNQRL